MRYGKRNYRDQAIAEYANIRKLKLISMKSSEIILNHKESYSFCPKRNFVLQPQKELWFIISKLSQIYNVGPEASHAKGQGDANFVSKSKLKNYIQKKHKMISKIKIKFK